MGWRLQDPFRLIMSEYSANEDFVMIAAEGQDPKFVLRR